MKNRYQIWSGVLLLATVTFSNSSLAQFIPADIEPERVRPQAQIELPKIQTVPDAVDYFFEPRAGSIKPGEKYPIVHMRIPKAPYFDKNSSNGPARSYGIHITMFYPNFSGMADSENFECHEDAKIAAGKLGFCRRQLTVGFEYSRKNKIHLEYKLLQDAIARGSIKKVLEKSKYPGLELVGMDIVDSNNQYYEGRETFYLSRDAKGEPEFVIRCNEYVVSPNCDINFRATKSPYIDISLTFVLALLPQWKEVIEKTRNKVDSMIVKTYELPIAGEK